MGKIRIDQGDLEMAISDGTMSWFLDRDTGAVIPLSDDNRMEEDDEIWEAIDAGSERYLEIPSRSSREGFETMDDFVATLEPGPARTALENALRRPRPFRSFKDALFGFPGVREAWFAYEQEALHAAAVDWLRVEGIDAELVPFTDGAAEGPQP